MTTTLKQNTKRALINGKMYISHGLFGGIVIYKVELKIYPERLSLKCEWNLGELKILNGERRPFQN